jgi:hypothetical protein
LCIILIYTGEDWRRSMYTLPLYEAKYNEKEEWKEISEVELMEGLYKVFEKVTPAIKEMIDGKEIDTPAAVYRLKIKGGERSNIPTT